MSLALAQAELAFKVDEVPIGAVLVYQNQVIAQAHNLKQTLNNPLKHAEMLVIEEGVKKLGKYLNECELYVTLEPCLMCAGAIVNARIKKLYIGTLDQKAGFSKTWLDLTHHQAIHHKMTIETGILQSECESILKSFFKLKRSKGNGII